MHRCRRASKLFLLLLFAFSMMSIDWTADPGRSGFPGIETVQAADGSADIQWFKEEMRISPKYLEKEEGVLGMTWAHFFTMLFLVLFLIGTLILYYRRNKRTNEILQSLLKEEKS